MLKNCPNYTFVFGFLYFWSPLGNYEKKLSKRTERSEVSENHKSSICWKFQVTISLGSEASENQISTICWKFQVSIPLESKKYSNAILCPSLYDNILYIYVIWNSNYLYMIFLNSKHFSFQPCEWQIFGMIWRSKSCSLYNMSFKII